MQVTSYNKRITHKYFHKLGRPENAIRIHDMRRYQYEEPSDLTRSETHYSLSKVVLVLNVELAIKSKCLSYQFESTNGDTAHAFDIYGFFKCTLGCSMKFD